MSFRLRDKATGEYVGSRLDARTDPQGAFIFLDDADVRRAGLDASQYEKEPLTVAGTRRGGLKVTRGASALPAAADSR